MREKILRIGIILVLMTLILLTAGCGGAPVEVGEVTPSTATAGSTRTPEPTETPTPAPCDRSAGGEVTRETLKSTVLGFSYTVSVYTPPCYGEEEGMRYPVLYLLHGQGMDDTFWLSLGVTGLADEMIAGGGPSFLMIMPYEVNDYDPVEDSGFGESVLTELIPWVEENYDVCTTRECRAIGGVSRGGGWAVRLAARNFDVFGAVGAHSMGLMAGDWWQIQKHLETHTVDEYPRIWIDRGEDDYLYEDIDLFVSVLEDNDILHEFHVWPGRHEVAYWQAHVAEYLAWYAEGWE